MKDEKNINPNDNENRPPSDTLPTTSAELSEYIHLDITEVIPGLPKRAKSRFRRRLKLGRRILVSRTGAFFRDTKKMMILWSAIILLIIFGKWFGWDQHIVGGVVVIIGLIFSAFSWLGAIILSGIAVIPFIGPPLVTILSSSILWIINGLGYFVSIVAIKSGHGRTVLNYRLLMIVFLTGLASGYVIAKLIE